MAKQIITYRCETCKREFENELSAISCENDHLIPIEITNYKFDINDKILYPISISIKLRDYHGNNKIIEYTRKLKK